MLLWQMKFCQFYILAKVTQDSLLSYKYDGEDEVNEINSVFTQTCFKADLWNTVQFFNCRIDVSISSCTNLLREDSVKDTGGVVS